MPQNSRGLLQRNSLSSVNAIWLAACIFAAPHDAVSVELYNHQELAVVAQVKFLGGIQYAKGINYGFGAIDTPGETQRAALALAIKPKFDFSWELEGSEVYSTFSMVAATTTLDGELSGQFARAGDQTLETDSTKIGWRNELIDVSIGGQEFTIGDGFVVGDGNFNKGGADGQFWIGGFSAWRNSSVLRVNSKPVRADVFWLRTDDDLGDARVVGVNIETTTKDLFGILGFMYVEIIDDDGFGLEGMQVASIRGADIKIPGIDNLKLFGEFVIERGESDLTGRDNDANAWYIEGNYQLAGLPWSPKLFYRYSYFSGDEPGSNDNEEYRSLFFTIFKRDWDTWYQGEVTGEYHLFNQNQITQMAKVKVYPRADMSLGLWYYTHDLDTRQYFGTPVTDTDWAEEVNFGVEYYPHERLYTYLGFAWGTPHQAAQEVFGGDEDTFIVQMFLAYTYR
jgi:hypothetical protein